MYRTQSVAAPIISLLSPSPFASRRARDALASLFSMEPARLNTDNDTDELDNAFHSRIPGFSRVIDSVALKCPSSGGILHFCSLATSTDSEGESYSSTTSDETDTKDKVPFDLLAITDIGPSRSVEEAIHQLRISLVEPVKAQATQVKLLQLFGRQVTSEHLLGSKFSSGLPFLSLPNSQCIDGAIDPGRHSTESIIFGLKEVAVPVYDYAAYADGSTVFSQLSESSMSRPKPGLYEWNQEGIRIRPLPTADGDRILAPVSLIFHRDSLEDVDSGAEFGAKYAKIGFNGIFTGQVMVLHNDLPGLDLRFCPRREASSMFSEAQESLLAASLDGLQNVNTLLQGGGVEQAKEDPRLGNGDCWIEVRANLKEPSGFWQRSAAKNKRSKHRIAKVPDLPYE